MLLTKLQMMMMMIILKAKKDSKIRKQTRIGDDV
jgi:hypothetical protein